MSKRIPLLDVGWTYRDLKSEIDYSIQRVMDSGWYILGDEVAKFEKKFSTYIGCKYTISVGNGLDALALSLSVSGIQPGDEVLVPGHTFIATYLAVSKIGAIPKPVDIDPFTGNILADDMNKHYNKKTKAIIPVHLYGNPCDMDIIEDFAVSKELVVVEDAAQAHGAKFNGRNIGAGNNLCAWSFYPGKNLGAFGDGGAITSNSIEDCDRLKLLRNYGSQEKYKHTEMGINSRLDELQAAILSVKLEKLDEWNFRRVKIAEFYLSNIDNELVSLPVIKNNIEPVWHMFVVKTKYREKLQKWLYEKGIDTGIHYPTPPYMQPAYSSLGYKKGTCPNAELFCEQCLSLPVGPNLKDKDISYIVEAVNSFRC